jgi:hypothetical protein
MRVWSVLLAGRVRRTLCIFVCSCVVVSIAYAEDELHFSNEFSYTYNDVSGPGSSQSSLTRGFRYLDRLNLYGNGNHRGFDYNWTLGTMFTDDRNNDFRNISITNLQGRVTNKTHTVNAGDTFESFSQYSLSSAVKGVSYRYSQETSGLPEITGVAGIVYPRWDNLFGMFDGKVQAIERRVYGARVKQVFREDFWAGLSFVRSEDHQRVNSTDPLYSNDAYTLDWEYKPIPGATIAGESSFTSQNESPDETAADISRHGHAHRITAIGDADPSRVVLEYERVTPNFTTLVGSATPDREKFKATWRYKHNRDITARTGFLWFRDNIDGQKSQGTTHHFKPEIGVTVNRFLGRQYAAVDLSYKPDLATRSDTTIQANHIVNLNYRDRFGVLDTDTNLGYTVYDTNGTTRSRSNEATYNTSLSSRHTLGIFVLRPAVYLGGWTSRDELASSTDQIYEYSVGVGLDIPDWGLTSSLKVGQNELQKSQGDDTAKLFVNGNIYFRPKFLEKVQGMLFLRAYVNDFRYTVGDRNFRETSVTAGMNVQM